MARKRKAKEEDNELRWLVTYGDVVTLMLAFFVMLYAISQVDQQKFLLFVSGLATPFGNPAVQEGVLTEGEGIVGNAPTPLDGKEGSDDGLDGIGLLDGLPELDETDNTEDIEITPESPPQPLPDPAPEPDRLLQTNQDLIELRAVISAALDLAGFEHSIDFELDQRGLVIAIATDNVLFASGSATFDARGEEVIGVLAPALQPISNELLVEGHTDSQPLRRPGYDNWNLSVDRALAVLKLLQDDYGIESSRLAATGYGEYRPRATNETEEGRAANRRVVLVIVAERGDP